MPRRKKKDSSKRPPLMFTESPVNIRHNFPSPVYCSDFPPTADVIPIDAINFSWVSPQFGRVPVTVGKTRQSKTRLRYRSGNNTRRPGNQDFTRSLHVTRHVSSKIKPLRFLGDHSTVLPSPAPDISFDTCSEDAGDDARDDGAATNGMETPTRHQKAESLPLHNSILYNSSAMKQALDFDTPVGNDSDCENAEPVARTDRSDRLECPNIKHNTRTRSTRTGRSTLEDSPDKPISDKSGDLSNGRKRHSSGLGGVDADSNSYHNQCSGSPNTSLTQKRPTRARHRRTNKRLFDDVSNHHSAGVGVVSPTCVSSMQYTNERQKTKQTETYGSVYTPDRRRSSRLLRLCDIFFTDQACVTPVQNFKSRDVLAYDTPEEDYALPVRLRRIKYRRNRRTARATKALT